MSRQYKQVFNEMKNTIDNQTLWMNPPKIDPVMMFLWGDRFTEETRFIGNPWLDRDYELKEPPSPFINSMLFIWIMILAYKEIVIMAILAIVLFGLFIRFFLKSS